MMTGDSKRNAQRVADELGMDEVHAEVLPEDKAAYVKQAAEYVEGKLPICTVIGFPNGYHTTAVKVFETKNAIANGAGY